MHTQSSTTFILGEIGVQFKVHTKTRHEKNFFLEDSVFYFLAMFETETAKT